EQREQEPQCPVRLPQMVVELGIIDNHRQYRMYRLKNQVGHEQTAEHTSQLPWLVRERAGQMSGNCNECGHVERIDPEVEYIAARRTQHPQQMADNDHDDEHGTSVVDVRIS